MYFSHKRILSYVLHTKVIRSKIDALFSNKTKYSGLRSHCYMVYIILTLPVVNIKTIYDSEKQIPVSRIKV